MSAPNANLILGFRPTQGLGPDMGKTISEAGNMLQVQQQQQQVQRQNALMGIFKDPSALDGTGNPTPQTLQKVMSVDPQVGMTLRQNMLIGQEHKLRTDALSSNLMAKKMDMVNEAAAPILETYENEVRNGTPEPQARRNAQEALAQSNKRLSESGVFAEDDIKRFPQQFDPMQMRNVVAGTEQYKEYLKNQRADTEEARKRKHDDDVNYNRGTSLIKDNQGNPVTYRPNAPTGQQFIGQDGQPVPPDRMPGFSKAGTGTPTAATQDRNDVAAIAKADYTTELGHPPEGPAEEAELKRRTIAAVDKRKTDAAAATAASRQAATSKAADVVVDGTKHQQAIWKYGQWFEPDGVTPVKGAVQGAGTARADQTLADREKHAEEMKDAGVPETPDQKAATAAQVATGEPMTQIIPGWGPASRKAQNEARSAAIQLIRDQTGMDPIDAGIELANRGIEYASGKKAQGIQQTMLSTTRTAVKQLDYNIDKVKEELTRLKSTNVSPVINAIMRKEQEWTGDPNLSSLFYSMSAVGMESARILSGGSASIQQLHEGAANEARKWANIGMTPASFESVSRTISEEGRARLKAWEDGIKEGRIGGQPKTGNTAPGAAQGGQPAFQPTDVDFLRKNPDKAALFDKRFGEGASKRALATPAQAAAPQAGFAPLTPNAAAPTVAQPTAAAAPAAKPQPGARPVPTELAQHADGVMTSQSTGQRWQKTGDQMWPIPEPMPAKEDGLKNGMIYQTKRGPARWDSEKKQFFTVGGS